MKTNNIARHGDLSFRSVDKIEGEKLEHGGSFVLAVGEHTNHKHVITVPDIKDMDVYKLADGSMILTLRKEGVLKHEEHKEIVFAPGTYKVGFEREHDYFLGETRRVQD